MTSKFLPETSTTTTLCLTDDSQTIAAFEMKIKTIDQKSHLSAETIKNIILRSLRKVAKDRPL